MKSRILLIALVIASTLLSGCVATVASRPYGYYEVPVAQPYGYYYRESVVVPAAPPPRVEYVYPPAVSGGIWIGGSSRGDGHRGHHHHRRHGHRHGHDGWR